MPYIENYIIEVLRQLGSIETDEIRFDLCVDEYGYINNKSNSKISFVVYKSSKKSTERQPTKTIKIYKIENLEKMKPF